MAAHPGTAQPSSLAIDDDLSAIDAAIDKLFPDGMIPAKMDPGSGINLTQTPGLPPTNSIWPAAQFEKLYKYIAAQFSPLSRAATLPGDTFRAMDAAARAHLCVCLSIEFKEVHEIVRDANRADFYLVAPSKVFRTTQNSFYVRQSGTTVPIFGFNFEGARKDNPAPDDYVVDFGAADISTHSPVSPTASVQDSDNGVQFPAQPSPAATTKPKIRRPPNAYILYRKDNHALVKAANPGIHNNQISVILGKKWHSETPEVRAHYKLLADEYKRKLMEEHPEYKYTPRKPSEVKRRRVRNAQGSPTQAQTQAPAQARTRSPPQDTATPFKMSDHGLWFDRNISMPMESPTFAQFHWQETHAAENVDTGLTNVEITAGEELHDAHDDDLNTITEFVDPSYLGLSDPQLTTGTTWFNVWNGIV